MLQSMAMTQLPIYSTNSITTYHPHRDFPFLIPALELDIRMIIIYATVSRDMQSVTLQSFGASNNCGLCVLLLPTTYH